MVGRLTPNSAAICATVWARLPVRLRAAARRCETGRTATNTNRCLTRVYPRRSSGGHGVNAGVPVHDRDQLLAVLTQVLDETRP